MTWKNYLPHREMERRNAVGSERIGKKNISLQRTLVPTPSLLQVWHLHLYYTDDLKNCMLEI
jgi:hypothetical protein